MKYIADVMLGSLAKRLRLLGYDVLYDRTFDDNEIIRIALEEDRLILTRDKALSQRPLAAHHLFIRSDNLIEQLEEVVRTVPSSGSRPLSRCSLCNTPLDPITKKEAKELVPDHVYRTQKNFFRCKTCGRIYWTGSHVQRMDRGKKKADPDRSA